MKLALDTNILAYAEGVNGGARQSEAVNLLERIRHRDVVLPVQVCGELFNVLVRKDRRAPDDARAALLGWREAFPLVGTSPDVMLTALDIAVEHQLNVWDATILATASSAGCAALLSEDMQDGFVWGRVTIANPFASIPHRVLQMLLASLPG